MDVRSVDVSDFIQWAYDGKDIEYVYTIVNGRVIVYEGDTVTVYPTNRFGGIDVHIDCNCYSTCTCSMRSCKGAVSSVEYYPNSTIDMYMTMCAM